MHLYVCVLTWMYIHSYVESSYIERESSVLKLLCNLGWIWNLGSFKKKNRSRNTNILSLFLRKLRDIEIYLRRRQWHPTPVLLPGKSHGRKIHVAELDRNEWLHFHFLLSCIGEGNGNPLQCSCLENPRDGGSWWAAVYGGHTESDMIEVT